MHDYDRYGIPRTRLTPLPAPTWTQSENNLLPKWIKFLERQRDHFGKTAIDECRNQVNYLEDAVADTIASISRYKTLASEKRQKLEALLLAPAVTDEQILEQYNALIESPHVVGTRIGPLGDLVILVDPHFEGADEHIEYGLYEIDASSYHLYRFWVHAFNAGVSDVLQRWSSFETQWYGSRAIGKTTIAIDENIVDELSIFNALPFVESFVTMLAKMFERANLGYFPLEKKSPDRLPWTGYVTDPVDALKRLQAVSGARTIAMRIDLLDRSVRRHENDVAFSTKVLAGHRKELREAKAELAKLEAAEPKVAIDPKEAAKSLLTVTTLPGVAAIRFDTDGIPCLHVRNSFVYDGRRYDLGDYELYLWTEYLHFGTVLKVRQTRRAAGGDYTAGWHPEARGYCFGNRNSDIMAAYQSGDMAHAVNLALGTMNTVNQGDRIYAHGLFREIGLNDVIQRRPRRRPRHRRRETIQALGAIALAHA